MDQTYPAFDMQKETKEMTGASAQYKGFTLSLAKGVAAPVILVINKGMTNRADGVVEIAATPAIAKRSVDRLFDVASRKASMEESERVLRRESDPMGIAAAMMSL